MAALSLSWAVVASQSAWASSDPWIYEPHVDPAIGFNLISWHNFGASGAAVWENAILDMHSHGVGHVSISPVRFFNKTTGAISPISTQAPELSHIAAGVAMAKSLGMHVTLNPFVEPVDFDGWRGAWSPPNEAARTQFWSDYQGYLLEVADLAEAHNVERLTIGTELRALVRDSANNPHITSLISQVDAVYDGKLGYAANWDNYNHGNVTAVIWENPAIDFMGVDAYFSLANNAQADASGAYPDESFIDLVAANWTSILDNQLVPFANARKGGDGIELVLTEHGLIPFNRTTVLPYSENAAFTQPVDTDEQVNGYAGLIKAIDGRLDDLAEVHIWHWGMPGAEDSFWYLQPDGLDVGGPRFDESLSQPAAQFLVGYLQTIPEPASSALLGTGLAMLLLRRRRAEG